MGRDRLWRALIAPQARSGGRPWLVVNGHDVGVDSQRRLVAALLDAAQRQVNLCQQNGSPTWAAAIKAVAARLGDQGAPTTRLLLQDGGCPRRSAIWLRLLAAVNRLLLAGAPGTMRRYIPALGGTIDPPNAVAAFFEFVEANEHAVGIEMGVPVQTNEVSRAGVLSAGLRRLATLKARPMSLLEVGASAGLNLLLDRYRVEVDGESWGPIESPVVLSGLFQRGTPAGSDFAVVERLGCDLAPVDASTAVGRLRLRSFVWPEHVSRLRRLDAALSIFVPVPITKADALMWVERELGRARRGLSRVVMHSIVMSYLPATEREALAAVIRKAGAEADETSPLGWLRMEPGEGEVVVELDVWPPGRHEVLARCDPHGGSVDWVGGFPSSPT